MVYDGYKQYMVIMYKKWNIYSLFVDGYCGISIYSIIYYKIDVKYYGDIMHIECTAFCPADILYTGQTDTPPIVIWIINI